MNNQESKFYGLLVNLSKRINKGDEQIYEEHKDGTEEQYLRKTRLKVFLNFLNRIIQNSNCEDDYVFAGAYNLDLIHFIINKIVQDLKIQFDTKFEKSLIKLKKFLDFGQYFNSDYHQLLYSYIQNNGAPKLKEYYKIDNLRKDMTNFKAKLIYNGLKKKKQQSSLKDFINKLPDKVKTNNDDNIKVKQSSQVNYWIKRIVDYYQINKQITGYFKNLDSYACDQLKMVLHKIIDDLQRKENEMVQNSNSEIRELKEIFQKINCPEISNQKNLARIEKFWNLFSSQQQIQNPNAKGQIQLNIQEIQNMKDLLGNKPNIEKFVDENTIYEKIKLLDFKDIPMNKCLQQLLKNNYNKFDHKFLFIITDGQSTSTKDEEEDLIKYAQKLKNEEGFIIVCYYFATSEKQNQNYLYSQIQENWDQEAKLMFRLTSEVSNFEQLFNSLKNNINVQLSESGKSRLFLQGNDPIEMQQYFDHFLYINNQKENLRNLNNEIQKQGCANCSDNFSKSDKMDAYPKAVDSK